MVFKTRKRKGFTLVLSLVLLHNVFNGGRFNCTVSSDHRGNNSSDEYQQTLCS